MPYCPSCGNEVNEEDKFCFSCGANLLEKPPTVSSTEERTEKEQVASRNGSGWAFLAVALLAAFAGGLVIWGVGQSGYGELQTQNYALMQQNQSLQAKYGGLSSDYDVLKTTVSTLEANLKTANADLKTANAEADRLQADVSTQRTINSTLSAELKKVKDPRHFATLQELTDWLAKDDTNTKYAKENYENLIFILQVRALRDGYLLPVSFLVEGVNKYANNRAVIGDTIYTISANNDHVELYDYIDPLPSHPLPLD